MPRRRSLARRALGWLAFASYLCVAIVVPLELLIRLFHPQVLTRDAPDLWQPDAAIGWRHRPGAREWINTGDRDVRICIDASGDRVDCEASERPACGARVLVVGDSFVEAVSVPFRETVWRRIEGATGACLDVAGVGGYGMAQYLKLVRERLQASEPYALVILNFYAGNDFTLDAERIPPPTDVQRRPLRPLPAGLDARDLYDWFYPVNAWLEMRSHLYVVARSAIRAWRDPWISPALRPSQLNARRLDGSERGIRLIAKAVRESGSKLLVVVIPHRFQVLDPQGRELLRDMPRLRGDLDMDLVGRLFVPRLRRIPGIAVLDLTPGLRAQSKAEHWARDGHLSPSGHVAWFGLVRAQVEELLSP